MELFWKRFAYPRNNYYIAFQLLTTLFVGFCTGRFQSAIVFLVLTNSLPCMYDFGIIQVCKYCVIAGLLLRNWCGFDSGNLLVVRGSFAAFCSPGREYSDEILCIVSQNVWKDKDKKKVLI